MAVCGNVAEQFEVNSFGGGGIKRDNSRGLEWGRGCSLFIGGRREVNEGTLMVNG